MRGSYRSKFPERDDAMIGLWNVEKLSMNQIAARVGISKGAVCNAMRRIRARGIELIAHEMPKAAPKPVKAPSPPKKFKMARTFIAGKGECRFPMWDNQERPTHKYCGKPAGIGLPYCEKHCLVCYPYMRQPMEEAA